MRLRDSNDILRLFEKDSELVRIIKVIENIGLPDWMLAAGVLRNYVWSVQHNYAEPYLERGSELDIFYFDSKSEAPAITKTLKTQLSSYSLDITNQATIHSYNHDYQDKPFKNAGEGLASSTETATAIGLTSESGKLKLICPWGTSDLLNLTLQMPPDLHNNNLYRDLFFNRITEKRWLEKWPKLKIID